jgi:hypothetical protein
MRTAHAAIHLTKAQSRIQAATTTLRSHVDSVHHVTTSDPFPATWGAVLSYLTISKHWIASPSQALYHPSHGYLQQESSSGSTTTSSSQSPQGSRKLRSDGSIDKVKPVILRGDMQPDDDTPTPDLSRLPRPPDLSHMAARTKCRIYQLDFIGAFLQSPSIKRTVTQLLRDGANYVPNLPNGSVASLCESPIYGSRSFTRIRPHPYPAR